MANAGTTPYGTSSGASTTGDGGGATEQAKEKAQEVKGQAQEKAQEAAGQAKGKLREQVDQRSTQYGQQVSTQASDIRSVGQQLREQGKEGPAKVADQAADRIERAGSWLTHSDGDQILHDVEDFARKNPWAVAAGGLALGFMASRFLKASSTDRYDRRSSAGQLPRHTSTPYDEQRFSRGPDAVTPPPTSPPPTSPPPTAHPGGR
ncbi:MAG: hypothetical protein HZB46_05035 [Solirubrobacterales bacterium]|nr:hypothetical protein [Solirubrobacterales bacterium]